MLLCFNKYFLLFLTLTLTKYLNSCKMQHIVYIFNCSAMLHINKKCQCLCKYTSTTSPCIWKARTQLNWQQLLLFYIFFISILEREILISWCNIPYRCLGVMFETITFFPLIYFSFISIFSYIFMLFYLSHIHTHIERKL